MSGETRLKKLINEIDPRLNPGEYVFSTVSTTDTIDRANILCEFKEQEGITVILERTQAETYGLTYEFVAAWITLNVHSALEAKGLTAKVATALAEHNISCNVIAGYYHDHLFVPHAEGNKAVDVLKALSMD
ncbi:ACT domain-containing protein [Ulvibacterium marinum]|uniref:ACT domain-containing protein n=1 Tax=Ulvibacterium marinum TaxID=2419782 RepID=UPI0024957D95|nr:ACT domain-containing protein [Ulvibacterium marinum]